MASYFSGLARDFGIIEDAPITDDALVRDVRRRTVSPTTTRVVPVVRVHPAAPKPASLVPGGGVNGGRMPTSLVPREPVVTDTPIQIVTDPQPALAPVTRPAQLTAEDHAELAVAEVMEPKVLLMALAVGGGLLWLLGQR